MKDDVDWIVVLRKAESQLMADPESTDASRVRAQAIGASEGPARGLAVMELHLKDHPSDAQAWDLMCAYLLNIGRLGAAREAGRRALELDPDNGIFHYNLACVLAMLGELREALESLGMAIDCDAELRQFAKEDDSFDGIRADEAFQALAG